MALTDIKPFGNSHVYGKNTNAINQMQTLGNTGVNPFGIPTNLNQIAKLEADKQARIAADKSLATTGSSFKPPTAKEIKKRDAAIAKKVKKDNGSSYQTKDSDATPFLDLFKSDEGGIGLGELSGYIVPGLDSIISAKQANEFYDASNLQADPLSLRYGQVQDLTKPNFATPARFDRMGSDSSSFIASQKLGDIAQRAQEANYEIQNSTSRIAQRDRVNNIANQEAQYNNQQDFAAKGFNAKVAATKSVTKDARSQEGLIGLTQNIQSGAAQRAYTKNNNKIQTAAELIRKGEIERGVKLAGF